MTFDPSLLPDGPFQEIYAYWKALGDEGEERTWARFDPLALPHLVPKMTVFDVDLERSAARIRFVGTDIIAAQGEDTTGEWLSDMSNMEGVEERTINAARTDEPYFLDQMPLIWTNADFKTYSTLGLPLHCPDPNQRRVVFLMIFS